MAANFSASAPSDETKATWLHDRSRIPAAPDLTRMERLGQYGPVLLGIVLALGALALAFQTRDSWSRGREFVVPLTTPILVLGGISLAYLATRGKLSRATWPGGFLLIAVILTVFNAWRGTISSGSDTARDVMSVLAAIVLGIGVVWLILAMVVTELKDPTRAPSVEIE